MTRRSRCPFGVFGVFLFFRQVLFVTNRAIVRVRYSRTGSAESAKTADRRKPRAYFGMDADRSPTRCGREYSVADLLEACRKMAVSMEMARRAEKWPWLNGCEEIRLGFRPRTIAVLAVSAARRHGLGPADLDLLIRAGVEMGDDVDAIAAAVRPERAADFRRLTDAYSVASRALRPETTTLHRLCAAFPTRPCWYLHNRAAAQPPRRHPGAVSPASLGPGYPPAMTTPAFAFLVPNRGDAYCTLLMKAHMLHEYAAQCRLTDRRCEWRGYGRMNDDEFRDEIVALVVRRTVAAVAFSWVAHAVQVDFLKRIGLLLVARSEEDAAAAAATEGTAAAATEGTAAADEERFVVAEQVAAAARAWDEMDSNNITFHQILPFENVL